MYTRYLSTAIAALAASQVAMAQTHTDCSPLERDDCPDNPALGGTVEIDFAKESSLFKSLSTPIEYTPEGAHFTIRGDADSPTIEMLKYIMFGRVDIELIASPGAGIVTSLVLESKDLDEIDWEWVGGNNGQVQSNYFSKGDASTYDRGGSHAVNNPLGSLHTYSIDWTKERCQWLINNVVVRELRYADAKGGAAYPQTPMRVKIGTWIGGRKGSAQGTIDWAGGLADFNKGPFTALYKTVKVTDYTKGSNGGSYHYSDRSGTFGSIKVVGGTGGSSDDSSSASGKPTGSKTSSSKPTATVTTDTSSAPTTLSTSTGSVANLPTNISPNPTAPNGGAAAPTQTPSGASQTKFANVALVAAVGYLAYLAM